MADEIITNTEGGAYNEGEVNTGGGDFVGRDQVTQTAAGKYIAQAGHGGTAETNVSTIDQRGQQISGDQYNAAHDITINTIPEEPPFWRRLSRANLVLVIFLSLIGTTAAILAIPGVSPYVVSLLAPPPFPPAAPGETLIVIAAFHQTGATKTEPHVKIQRAIDEAAGKAGLKAFRVEVAPTELNADQRIEAEALGRQFNAGIVIWGEDTGVQVLVNFLNLKQANYEAVEVKINETERTQLVNPDAYARFILSDLPGQLTFLSFFAVGQSLYQAKDYFQAKEVIEHGVASLVTGTHLDGLPEAYFRLGWLDQTLGDLAAAIQDYTKAIEPRPGYSKAYINRGAALFARGSVVEAIQDYNRAIEAEPKDAPAYYNRGIALYAQGKLAEAIRDYTTAIELQPEYAPTYINRGAALAAQGKLAEAIQDYTTAIELDPEDAEAYYNRGAALYAQGKLAEAIQDYTTTIELQPEYAPAYNNRGIALADRGSLAEAIQDYTRAIELQPEGVSAYINRGAALYAQGSLAEAIQDYSRAIELNPGDAPAYINRGVALYAQGSLAEAIQDFSRAIELQPEYAPAYSNRGIAHYKQGNLAEGSQDYTRAIELDPEYAPTYNNLCWWGSLSGQAAEVMDSCEQAITLAPDDGMYRDSRGLARALVGDYTGAIEDFEFFIEWLKANGQYDQYGPAREAWVTELKAGRNPFDQTTLETLREE